MQPVGCAKENIMDMNKELDLVEFLKRSDMTLHSECVVNAWHESYILINLDMGDRHTHFQAELNNTLLGEGESFSRSSCKQICYQSCYSIFESDIAKRWANRDTEQT